MLAVMVAAVDVFTAVVVMVNVPVEAPAATVTVAGTVALVELELRDTDVPPVGALPVRVTVPVEDVPPWTEVGETATVETAGEFTVRVAVAVAPPNAAVITGDDVADTGVVFTVNVAVLEPAATVTVAGTVAVVRLELRLTTAPPEAALAFRVTVPVEVVPPVTAVGFSETLATAIGLMVRVAFTEPDPVLALMVAVVEEATVDVETVNVAVLDPAGTVTEPGTVADGLVEIKLMTAPPVPALAVSVTVPVEVAPPTTVVGESVREAIVTRLSS